MHRLMNDFAKRCVVESTDRDVVGVQVHAGDVGRRLVQVEEARVHADEVGQRRVQHLGQPCGGSGSAGPRARVRGNVPSGHSGMYGHCHLNGNSKLDTASETAVSVSGLQPPLRYLPFHQPIATWEDARSIKNI